MNGRRFSLVGLIILSCLCSVLLSACGGSEKKTAEPEIRRLSREEMTELEAMQSLKEQVKGPLPDQKLDPVQLESKGDSLHMANQLMSALFSYNRALALVEAGSPAATRLRGKLARIYLQAGHWIQSEFMYAELTKENPDAAAFWEGLGLARLAQGMDEPAEENLLQAVSLNPRLWKSENGLGVIYNNRRQPLQAMKHFDQAIRLRPENPTLYNNRGLSFMLLGDLDKAGKNFKEALYYDPKHRLARNNLALALAKAGKVEEAVQYFESTLGRPKAHNNVGCILAWQGDYHGAVEQFREAVVASPVYYPLAQKNLEEVRRQLDRARRGDETTVPKVQADGVPQSSIMTPVRQNNHSTGTDQN